MMRKQQHKLLLDTVLLGVVGALSAQVFVFLLRLCQALFLKWLAGYQPLVLSSNGSIGIPATGSHGLWLIPLATTLGGLLAGVLVYSLAPEAEGHGTDAVVNAFHNLGGVIRARVPFVKLIASAITIGSGGSAGREGSDRFDQRRNCFGVCRQARPFRGGNAAAAAGRHGCWLVGDLPVTNRDGDFCHRGAVW